MISRTEIEGFTKSFEVVSIYLEHEGDILMLHRQDHKPQGNTWGPPAGKLDPGETHLEAIVRETEEEIGVRLVPSDLRFVTTYYVRYADYDFLYHVYHLPLDERPLLEVNLQEHKDARWLTPAQALELPLIEDEDQSIKWFYDLFDR